MKTKISLFVLTILLVFPASIKAQSECTEKLIMQIETLIKENGITRAEVMFHRVNSVGESTITSLTALAQRDSFRFEGRFLVIGDTYFNVEKLLFFKLQIGYIQFFFQAY
jgi:hypothetical protein